LPVHSNGQNGGGVGVVGPEPQDKGELRGNRMLRLLFHSGPGGILFFALLLAGCTRALPRPAYSFSPQPVRVSLAFPPQKVMENGNYTEFLTENEKLLQGCQGGAECDTALFNLGFVYAYPPSPYRDPAKALRYFDELLKKYPQSPWALQGRAWVTLITENLALEESRRQLQADLSAREATIRSLRAQLDRSRAIDIEMEKRERELLR
jgi:hypothetical protein